MKRFTAIVLLMTLSCLLLTGCFCQHEWLDATCDDPMTCAKCGKTTGDELEHIWVDADCVNPKTCSLCGKTRGEAINHSWIDASCTAPKTCEVCGTTEGTALSHDWQKANCLSPEACALCGKTQGETGSHDWNYCDGTVMNTCRICDTKYGLDEVPFSDAPCHDNGTFNLTYKEFQSTMFDAWYPDGPYYMGLNGIAGDNENIAMYTFVTFEEMDSLSIYGYTGFNPDNDQMNSFILGTNITNSEENLTCFMELVRTLIVVIDGNITYMEAVDLFFDYNAVSLQHTNVNYRIERNGMTYWLANTGDQVLFIVGRA